MKINFYERAFDSHLAWTNGRRKASSYYYPRHENRSLPPHADTEKRSLLAALLAITSIRVDGRSPFTARSASNSTRLENVRVFVNKAPAST